jgi:hypothetical protein
MAVTVTVALALLLLGFASGSLPVTLTGLTALPTVFAMAVRVMVALAPDASAPKLHVTVVVPVHEP